MKYLLLTFIVLFSTLSIQAQKDKYAKIKEKFAAEKYEDVAFKAAMMTDKESMRKDPEPYLFLAMSYLKIAADEELAEDYPKAMSDSYKYAAKTRKKDKSGKIYKEYIEFFNELKQFGINDATGFFESGNYSKAAKSLKIVNKFCPEDNALKFAKGVFNIKARNMGEGGLWIKESARDLRKEYDASAFKLAPGSASLFTKAFGIYTEYLIENKQLDSAKSTIELGLLLLPNDLKIKELSNKLN